MMRIIGIDPGTATTGYGVIDVNNGVTEVVGWGLIETQKNGHTERRLETIFKETTEILKKYHPDTFAIEKIFFAANAKTAIAVGQAQGVLMLAASQAKIKMVEYAPGTIKKTVTGDGRAEKMDIQRAVRKILGNKVRSKAKKRTHFDNAADALAVALCHSLKLRKAKGGEKNG